MEKDYVILAFVSFLTRIIKRWPQIKHDCCCSDSAKLQTPHVSIRAHLLPKIY